MIDWLIAAAVGLIAAALLYGRQRGAGPAPAWRIALGTLRAAALTLVVALLLDAPLGRARPAPPTVFVDASLSMTRENAALAGAAWDSATSVDADSIWFFGDTIRPAARETAPSDRTTRVRPVVERTMASGRPAVLITDGEVEDSSALDALVSGSRIVVLSREPGMDAAVVAMEAPRAAVAGDSLDIRLTIGAGARGAAAGSLALELEGRALGRWPMQAMSPWSERQVEVRARADGITDGAGILRAVLTTPGDAEPRNDTLAATLELSRAASAVVVSTSPDQDVRFAIAVLRGALALPTRGFLRVAPGMWRHEGSLTPATEAEVRAALRDAPIAILHGDTLIFGPPRSVTLGPLALMIPAEEDGEWYPVATPVSPLSAALSAIPLESLPPVAAGASGAGDWIALEARRGREAQRRPLVVGSDAPRRVVLVTGSGFWRWRFRGGASADAFAALWGGIFDWLAAERADRRGAVPEATLVRSGQSIRWRRGSTADSLVHVLIQPRPSGRQDTLVLRFGPGTSVQETTPLPSGVYDVIVPGGRALLAVNASAELLPRRPRLQSGSVGTRRHVDEARRARNKSLLYILVVALLCAEWMTRRRIGLR
jgi:hypothetical protein